MITNLPSPRQEWQDGSLGVGGVQCRDLGFPAGFVESRPEEALLTFYLR